MSSFPSGLAEVHLSRNFRNTQRIHAEAMRFSQGEPVEAVGPDGDPVERVTVASDAEVEPAVARLLERMTGADRVAPSDIAVLTGSSSSALRREGSIGRCVVTCREDAHPGAVLVESIRRFKGLERPVVILADLGGIDATELPAMMYVGVSRARAHLAIVQAQPTTPVTRDQSARASA